jgi:hypothetical protein
MMAGLVEPIRSSANPTGIGLIFRILTREPIITNSGLVIIMT